MSPRTRTLALVLAIPAIAGGALLVSRWTGGRSERGSELPSSTRSKVAAELQAAEPLVPGPAVALALEDSTAGARTERHEVTPDEAPFRGRLVDEFTGEGLGECVVELSHGDVSEQVTTQSDGDFLTRQAFAAGLVQVRVRLLDVPENGRAHRRLHPHDPDRARAGGVVTIEVPITPEYELDVRWPAGATRVPLEACLIGYARAEPESTLRRPGTPVRGDGPYRVRFLQRPSEVDTLVVRGTNGSYWGQAPAPSGHAAEPIVVHLKAYGCLELEIVDQAGKPLPTARFALVAGGFERKGDPDGEGRERMPYLLERTYRIESRNSDFAHAPIQVRVRAGEVTAQRVVMQRLEVAGTISGELRSESGRERLPRSLVLLSLGEVPQRELSTWVEWEHRSGTGSVGHFEWEDVPVGRYRLAPSKPDMLFGVAEWSPGEVELEAPAEGLVFTLLDRDRMADLGFVLTDAETGRELDQVQALYGDEPYSGRSGASIFSVSLSASLPRLIVGSPGYSSVEVEAESFRAVLPHGPRFELLAELELERGWKRTLLVATLGPPAEAGPGWLGDLDRVKPLLDAEVFVDGERYGTTDPSGTIELQLAAPPRRIELRAPAHAAFEFELEQGRPVDSERIEVGEGLDMFVMLEPLP